MLRSLLGLAAVLCTLISHADEGMWPFNQLPKAEIKAKYGVELTDAWVNHVMRSTLRLSGGTGSFISPTGLVLTNHHVAADTLAKVSTHEHDYYTYGFLAATPAEEIRAPDIELQQLQEIRDVTAEVNAAVTPGMGTAQALAAQKAAMAELEKSCATAADLKCEVVTLYQGGQFHLYRYKRYTDVRIVFAPEFDIAFYGGDPDNFEFPRYDLDMAILRAYENGAPAITPDYLAWSERGVAEGEATFTSGNPGTTNRMMTVAALEFQRDVSIPALIAISEAREKALIAYGQLGEEQKRQAKGEFFGVQNSLKVYRAQLRSLKGRELLDRKSAQEKALRAQVQADPAIATFDSAWPAIAEAQAAHARVYYAKQLLETARGIQSKLFTIARQLARIAEEDQKPDNQRLAEYREANRPALLRQLLSPAPIYPEFEQAKLVYSMALVVAHYGPETDVVRALLDGKSIEARAAELIGGTQLADVAMRQKLLDGGPSAIASSQDPFIRLALALDPASRALRAEHEARVEAVETESYGKIAKVLFGLHGTSAYPDATFTLRLSYGSMKGYATAAGAVPANTTFGGVFPYEQAHGAQAPYKLPATWHAAKDQLDPATPFNFVSTNDIIGGNSGSPVVNARGELVGLVFDMNAESLVYSFAYDDVQGRTVSVHSRGMIEALRKIYGAGALANEILGHAQ
jgi:hypothetical protein